MGLLKSHTRTVKYSLEEQLGIQIPNDHNLLTWMVHFASETYNRFHVGSDGRTPRERCIGRKGAAPLARFGESVGYKPLLPKGKAPTLDERFRQGFFVGYVAGSTQGIVLTSDGSIRFCSANQNLINR